MKRNGILATFVLAFAAVAVSAYAQERGPFGSPETVSGGSLDPVSPSIQVEKSAHVLRLTDGSGAFAEIHYGNDGRPDAVETRRYKVTLLYATAFDSRPSIAIRDGVAYSLSRGKHGFPVSPFPDPNPAELAVTTQIHPKFYSPDDPDFHSVFDDWVYSCMADPTCFGGDQTANGVPAQVQEFVNNLASWLQVFGVVGAGWAVGMQVATGEVALELLAAAATMGFTAGTGVGIVFLGGVWIGTVIYDKYGNAFWLSH
jgi:hypothetical protein